jgi:hypothetical protein
MIDGPGTAFAERLGIIVGIALVLNMSFMTVAPYVFVINPISQRLIDQQQTILQSIFMVLVGYLWGNSAGNKSKDHAIGTLADTAKAAQAALAPVADKADVVLKPGESKTIEAQE